MQIESGTYEYYIKATIGDFVVATDNIELLLISMDLEVKLPLLRFVFSTGSVLQRNAPIQDGSTIDIAYGIDEDNAKKTSFVVRSCVFVQNASASTSYTYTIVGVLNVNDHKAETAFFEKMASDKVAKQIADKHGFEFSSDISGADEMTWLQACQDDWSFLKDVEEHAYVRDWDAVIIYPDIWKTLTYTTLKTRLNGPEKTTLVAEGNVANLDDERKKNFLRTSNCKMLHKSGIINSISAYGTRVSMIDDGLELNLEFRDNSSTAKNVSKKADFSKDLAANVYYGYQPINVHPYYLYAKALGDHLRLVMFADIAELQISTMNHTEEQMKILLDLKPGDCVYYMPMLQMEEKDTILEGKYLVKRLDVKFDADGLNIHLLIGRNGMNLTGEYEGTPIYTEKSGEEQPTGVQAMGEANTDTVEKFGPLGMSKDMTSEEEKQMYALEASSEEIADWENRQTK